MQSSAVAGACLVMAALLCRQAVSVSEQAALPSVKPGGRCALVSPRQTGTAPDTPAELKPRLPAPERETTITRDGAVVDITGELLLSLA